MRRRLDRSLKRVENLEPPEGAETDLKKFLNKTKDGMGQAQKHMEDLNQDSDTTKKFGPYSNTIVERMQEEQDKVARVINHLKEPVSTYKDLDILKEKFRELSKQISNKIGELEKKIQYLMFLLKRMIIIIMKNI